MSWAGRLRSSRRLSRSRTSAAAARVPLLRTMTCLGARWPFPCARVPAKLSLLLRWQPLPGHERGGVPQLTATWRSCPCGRLRETRLRLRGRWSVSRSRCAARWKSATSPCSPWSASSGGASRSDSSASARNCSSPSALALVTTNVAARVAAEGSQAVCRPQSPQTMMLPGAKPGPPIPARRQFPHRLPVPLATLLLPLDLTVLRSAPPSPAHAGQRALAAPCVREAEPRPPQLPRSSERRLPLSRRC